VILRVTERTVRACEQDEKASMSKMAKNDQIREDGHPVGIFMGKWNIKGRFSSPILYGRRSAKVGQYTEGPLGYSAVLLGLASCF